MIPTRLQHYSTNDYLFVGFYRTACNVYAAYTSKTHRIVAIDGWRITPEVLDTLSDVSTSSGVLLYERNFLKGVQVKDSRLVPQTSANVPGFEPPLPRIQPSYLCFDSTPYSNDTVQYVLYGGLKPKWVFGSHTRIAYRNGYSTVVL